MGERLPPLLRPAPVLTTRGKRGGRASPFPLCPPVRRGQIPHVPVKASLIGRRITCRTPSPACALNTSGLRGAYHHGDRSPAGPHAQGSPRYTRLGSPRVPARPSGRAYRSSLPGCRNRRRPRPPPRPELRGGMLPGCSRARSSSTVGQPPIHRPRSVPRPVRQSRSSSSSQSTSSLVSPAKRARSVCTVPMERLWKGGGMGEEIRRAFGRCVGGQDGRAVRAGQLRDLAEGALDPCAELA